jgi:hypothetical protein
MIHDTNHQYNEITKQCTDLFVKKMQDYGTAWDILRLPSLTDQIYIKANRIRSIQEKGEQKVSDDIVSEFVGIINYSAMAIIKLNGTVNSETVQCNYQTAIDKAYQTMQAKNHDYGEAWRNMRVSSITDLILMKILRIKQIEDNNGKTLVSEGVEANYIDILNYAVFCLMK